MQIRSSLYHSLSAVMLLMHGSSHADEEPQNTQQREVEIIEKTLEIEILASKERRKWQSQQSAIQELIKLYESELLLIEEELNAVGSLAEDFDSKAEALKEQTLEMKAQRTNLFEQSKKQASRLLLITELFPQPLREQIAIDKAVLENRESGLRETLTSMVAILKSASQFNRTVNYAELIQEVKGEKRQMRILYLGLGQAYYVSGETAGIGKPSKSSWVWEEVENSRINIERAIAVFQKTRRPELIKLPVQR